ncbi:MAG: hypothetical protein AB7J35_20710 [Dehalococcoidia bacterium]
MRFAIVILVAGLAGIVMPSLVNAADPGTPSNARVELREGAGGEIQVVVRWEASANPDANYEVWRRTPWDVAFQVTEPYANVPASARLADGTFEFVDPAPFSIPERPCYQIGATVGDPIQSSALAGCIPTLPKDTEGLSLAAIPAPAADTWFITGHGFAAGARVQLQEIPAGSAPPSGLDLRVSTQIETNLDGRFSVEVTLPPASDRTKRRIAAFEPGWLSSQFASAPVVEVSASNSGTVVGYPPSMRTGEPAVDRILDILASGDEAAFAAVLQFRKLPAPSDGSLVDAIPRVTCGNGDGLVVAPESVPITEGLNAFLSDFFGYQVYAVFQVAPVSDSWMAYKGATHVIVLARWMSGYQVRAAALAVNGSGVVGAGQPCGEPPTFYLRDVGSFLLPPLTSPAPPATGNAASAGSDRGSLRPIAWGLLLVSATFGTIWCVGRSRPG